MPKKVLLIDDDHNLLELANMGLSQAGYRVMVASDGQQGVEMAKKDRPDLVILDINMPRMDGWQALKFFRSLPGLKTIPVVMLTTEGLIKDVDKAMEMGATGYLVKPLDIGRLLKKVSSILGQP